MTRAPSFVVCWLAAALAACSGEQGPAGRDGSGVSASISGVSPNSVFVGARRQVALSGYGTQWDASTTCDFGDGITVSDLVVASPTSLLVTLTPAFDVAPGVRDVQVTTGSQVLSFSGAFNVEAATHFDLLGQPAQGGVFVAEVQNLDFSRPFDGTTEGDGFFTPLTYPHFVVTSDPGLLGNVNSVEPYHASVTMLADVTFPPGPASVSLLSGPSGSQDGFQNPAAFLVQARSPVALDQGTGTGTVHESYDSLLFSLDLGGSGDLRILEVTATAPGAGATSLFMLPSSGRFADLLTAGSSIARGTRLTGSHYFVYWDNTGTADYDVAVDALVLATASAPEAEPNDDAADALVAPSLPFTVTGGRLSGATDVDVIAVNLTAADVGKHLRVRTYGDTDTDTRVEVFDPGGNSLGSSEVDYHEGLDSDAILGPGTYLVEIGSGAYFDATVAGYDAYVRIVD